MIKRLFKKYKRKIRYGMFPLIKFTVKIVYISMIFAIVLNYVLGG